MGKNMWKTYGAHVGYGVGYGKLMGSVGLYMGNLWETSERSW